MAKRKKTRKTTHRKTTARKRKTRKSHKSGHRPVSVLKHFYHKTERKQRTLAALIKKRGGGSV